ncbi:hypothetical protein [Catenulispora subtropica]
MVTVLMVIVVVGLAVLLIGGAVKAGRLERSAARAPETNDHRERLTDEDRQYIQESLRHAEGVFPQNPAVAVDMAHHSVATVLHARGVDARIPARRDEDEASPEELRRQLLQYEDIVGELIGAGPRA